MRDNDTRDYWKNKTYLERLEALEQLRQYECPPYPTNRQNASFA